MVGIVPCSSLTVAKRSLMFIDKRLRLVLELLGMAADRQSKLELLPTSEDGKKSEFTFFSGRTLQYYHFNAHLGNPDWTRKKILDFGGNVGGFLMGAPPTISQEDYWCVDLHKPALERGRQALPRAHFVFYNRYHNLYNSTGIVDLPVPDLGQTFDFILAFSVFTHTSVREMQEILRQLMGMLKSGGTLAFTFEDHNYDPVKDPRYDMTVADQEVGWGSNLRHRLLRVKPNYPGLDVEQSFLRARNARWCALVGNCFYVEPEDVSPASEQRGVGYHQYHTVAFMKELFSAGEFFAPLSPLRQHFCVLRA
jgi:SAM-dependent methyltransferase